MSSFLARVPPRRILLLLAVPSILLFFIALRLYHYPNQPLTIPRPSFFHPKSPNNGQTTPGSHVSPAEPLHDGEFLSAATIASYLDAIVGRNQTTLPTLDCPKFDESRYNELKIRRTKSSKVPYFFALDLRKALPLLPQLVGSIVKAAQLLGPENCALSIVEGNSDDGTRDVLSNLDREMASLGVNYTFQSTTIDPSKDDRIGRLAALRNLALEPLLNSPEKYDKDTTIIFLNDVSICPDDILELVKQRKNLGADMTCAMDWTYAGNDPTFYDVWVARGITGESFFLIPPGGSWDSAWNLFWNDQASKSRLDDRLPFQVFSCWNGATAFTAQAILDNIRFRKPNGTECTQGEPQLFCKDLWLNGFGRIAVVPSINVEYSIENGIKIKNAKGFTSANIEGKKTADYKIEWRQDPPEQVKCMPTYENQFFQPWNEGHESQTTNHTT